MFPVPPPGIFALRDMIEQLLVCHFLAVPHSAQVLHLDVVLPPDELVRLFFEGHHFWVFSPDGVGRPYIRGCDPVQGQAAGDDHIKHFQAVLSMADPRNILELLGFDV